MINIAHLSDIHFGSRFSEATWKSVADCVVAFDPDLIIVSGDLVDDPSPSLLLAAKCALRDLLQRVQSNKARPDLTAELVVIPGNHDVYESGVAVGLPRLPWFERIFHCEDTSQAEAALNAQLGPHPLGFNGKCLGLPAGTRPQDATLAQAVWARIKTFFAGRTVAPWQKAQDFTNLLGAPSPQPQVRTAGNLPVLLALLDSNPAQAGPYAATGFVDNDQLIGLQNLLASVKAPYLARIAVVHHHVLPIAFAAGQAAMTGEPLMVLRNAGAVMRVLADHKFDLVVHGHWHKAQFARIDFGSDDLGSYPIAVASAGSAAMTSPDNTGANSFNLITIADNGRITVKNVFYGAGQAPNPGGDFREYEEPIAAAKRRAYIRARERHAIECDVREQICEITENGDLWVTHRVTGLRLNGQPSPYTRRPLAVYIPPHGHFIPETLEPDAASSQAGVSLTAAPDHPKAGGRLQYYWINLSGGGLVRGGKDTYYGVSHGCANCMTMTHWEAVEKAKPAPGEVPRAGFDYEWVAARIVHPVGRLVLRAKFPPSLAMVQPQVACQRHPQYPAYKIDDWGDAEMDPAGMLIDPELQEAEKRELHYEASTRTWTLDVDRPIVGYQYGLSWQVPDDKPDRGIAGETREWRRNLLNLGGRVGPGSIQGQFDLLCDALQSEVCKGGRDEKWVIALFVYESEGLVLRPVLSRRSWSTERLPMTFGVPYGDGVSGAAFQQRRIIAWSQAAIAERPEHSARSLIKPVPHPAPTEGQIEMVNVLALPIYHSELEDARRPPPWATIGVVTIGSSSDASIARMDDTQRRRSRSGAQTQTYRILEAARRRSPPPAP
jgi:3',5'-cyclic AMP phosphodiesterase CpdA